MKTFENLYWPESVVVLNIKFQKPQFSGIQNNFQRCTAEVLLMIRYLKSICYTSYSWILHGMFIIKILGI